MKIKISLIKRKKREGKKEKYKNKENKGEKTIDTNKGK